MEIVTLKNYRAIIREDGLRCFVSFFIHRLVRHETWIVHQFHQEKEA